MYCTPRIQSNRYVAILGQISRGWRRCQKICTEFVRGFLCKRYTAAKQHKEYTA
jgi:hypothetical protein